MKTPSLKIIFAGTPEFAAIHLQALLNSTHQVVAVYTQPDRKAGRGQHLHESQVKILARDFKLPILQPTTLKDTHVQQQLAKFEADIMVVVAYGLILPASVLSIPRLGCINVHASLLPRWRGASPIQQAILANESQTGISIIKIIPKLDAGPIIKQTSLPITNNDDATSLHDKLASLGATTLISSLNDISQNNYQEIPQDESLVTYAPKINKQDAIINWQASATTIDCQIRAYNPWPVSYTILGNKTIRVWQAQILKQSIVKQTPGTIVSVNREGIEVATSDYCLRITKLQLPGGKPLMAAALLNSQHNLFIPGAVFTRGNNE